MAEKIKQVVVPRKRGAKAKQINIPSIDMEKVKVYTKLGLRISAMVICLALVMFLYNQLVSLPAFQLQNIEVSGNSRISSAEVEKTIRNNMPNTLFSTNLKKVQEHLQSCIWIKHAQVTRILPDTLRIKIEERKALALVRFEGEQTPVWLDEDAIVLGEYDNTLDKELPPLVIGLSRETAAGRGDSLEKIQMYQQVIGAFDAGPKKFSPLIEEIDLSNLKDIRVQLSESSVEVDLGDRDFRARLTRAVDILTALRHRDMAKLKDYKFLDPKILEQPEQIKFISVVHPTQIAIRAAKPVQTTKVTSDKVAFAQKER